MVQANILFNNRYRLMERKGSGSFGEVWLARDGQLDMDVAVKIYIALDDRGIEEFKEEYKTAYTLNHPNLLHAYHFDICDRRPFLVMPYCPNSATSLIGCCDNDTLWRFIKDVSSGLSYLHSLDIVHHDIKPDNILITEEGRFVITDFGISTKMRSTLRRHSTRAAGQNSSGGSLPYMGPEMFTGKPESVKATDIWAFGATLYELITGELPFFGQGGVMQLNGAAVPEIDFPDNDIVSLVRACLAKETWDRPTADEISRIAETRTFAGRCAEKTCTDTSRTVRMDSEAVQTDENTESYIDDKVEDAAQKATPKKKRHVFWVLLSVAVLITLAVVVIANGYIQVGGKGLVASAGETITYSVSTNMPFYTISDIPSWATLEWKNKDSFSVRYDSDPSGGKRYGTIVVLTLGHFSRLNIVQKPIATYLKLSNTSSQFTADGGNRTYKVNTDGDSFEISGLPSWCSIASQEDKSFKISCTANTSKSSRSGSFTVTADDKEVEVYISQSGKTATYLTVNNKTAVSSTYSAEAGTCYYSVGTDGDSFEVSALPSWCKVSDRTASSFTISYDKNTGSVRSDWFSVTSDSKSVRVNVTQETAGPFASIENVTVDHNVYEDGKKGMMIHTKFSIDKMKGKTGQFAVYFYRQDGTPLKDTNSSYRTTDGNVATSTNFTPSYESSVYKDFKIFMPYSELHITDSGRWSCYFEITIWDQIGPSSKSLCESGKYSFYYER